MAAIETIGKAWTHPKTGEVRYYVNGWKSMIDLEVEYYKSGNVSDVHYHGEQLSNGWYKKNVASTKVWVGEDMQVHVDYCKDEDVEREIIEKIGAYLQPEPAEVEEVPETETITVADIAMPLMVEVSVTSAQTACKGHMAVVYAERNAPAIYLGEYTANHSMTTEEVLDLIGLDTDAFAADMGWDGFDVDAVRTVPSEGCDLERGDEIPEVRVIIDTPSGLRYIEVPDVGEALWDGVELYDSIHGTTVYDDCTEEQVWADDGAYSNATPLDPEDLTPKRFISVAVRGAEEFVEYHDTAEEAVREAKDAWDRLSAEDRMKHRNYAAEIDPREYPGDIDTILWDSEDEAERIRSKVYRDLPVLVLEKGLTVNEAVAWSVSDAGYGPTEAARLMTPILGREVKRTEVGKYMHNAKMKM